MEEKNNNRIPDNLVYPTIPFEEFYHKFKIVREMTQDKEWVDVLSKFYTLDKMELDIPIGETTNDLNEFDAEKQIEEIVKCAKNFFYWCHRYVKILHTKYGTIPFVPYSYQRRAIEEFENKKFNMVSKFRQGGLTTIAVLWGLWKCGYQKDQQIYFLSKTDREALAAGDIARRAMDNFPYWMFDSRQTDITKHEKKFNDVGSKLCFYTPEAARGKSATNIIIDEAAFIDNMDEHWKAMYPVVAAGGSVQIISTVNGIGNWYEECYREAEVGKNFFNIIDLDYWEHPTYANPIWAEEMKSNLGEKGWRQEVLRDFLGSGETYVSSNVIAHLDRLTKYNDPVRNAFQKWTNENQKKNNKDGALWIWKEPMEGHEYFIGVDSSEGVGQEGDNSCFEIIDAISLEQIAEFYSNTVPPHIYAQIINQIGIYYNNATVVVENNAIGGAVLNYLINDIGYEAIYYEHKKGISSKPGIKVSVSNRQLLLESMQQRLTNGTSKINSCRLVEELKTFIYSAQKKRAEATKGRHDDAIMALCLALYARDETMRGVPIGSESSNMLKILKSNSFEEIKNEILEGGIEDWAMDYESESIKEFTIDQYDMIETKRQNDKILKEFNW